MKVNVTATRCIVENDVELNAGEYNINKFYFTFSPEYLDNYVKKALFVAKDQPPIEMVIANDECDIPYDILKKPGTYMFGVYAYEVGDNEELILRYSPEPTHFYVNKGSYIENAESPTEPEPDEFAQYYQAMQELVANAKPELIDYIEDNLPTIHVGETSTLTPGTPATVTNVGTERNPIFDFRIPQGVPGTTDYNELVNKPDLTVFALITESANKIALEMDPTEFKIKAKISDKNNRLISESNVIDLPLESVVVSGEYDATNKKIILTLENGNVIEIPVEDLIDGLATKTELEEGLATKDANIIESISKNGTPLPVNANKNVNITVPTRTSEVINDSGFITNDTNGLSHYYDKTASDTRFSLVNETGSNFILSIDPTTFVMTATLKDKNGRTLSIQTVDLPLESVVVGGRYDSETREVVLTLENGSVVRFSVADLVSGLQSEITDSNKLASGLVDDTNSTNKFVTIQEKEAWNNKSDFSGSYNDLTNKPDLTIYEEKTNKITTLSEESTDIQYPSGKCVYESQKEQNEEIDRLEMVYNALPSEEATGESITIDGTAEVPFRKIDLKGNTYQYSTTGKNLVNVSLWGLKALNTIGTWNGDVYTSEGIVYTPVFKNNLLQYINVNGTATAQSILVLRSIDNPVLPYGSYILNGCPSGGSLSTYRLNWAYSGANDTGNGSTATFNRTGQIRIIIDSGATVSNLQFKPMVRLTTISDSTYEPYTNGASPNPDYPQDIHVVSGDNTIKVEGKNLFDKTVITENQRLDSNGNEYYDVNCVSSDYIKIQPNTIYTRNITASVYENICFYTINKVFINRDTTHATTTSPNNAYYVRISCYKTNLDTLQLEKGSTTTEYTPYVSQSYPINLGDIELCKIEDYQDSIKKSTGKNLFDKDNINVLNAYINADENKIIPSSNNKTIYMQLKPNTTYTLSFSKLNSNGRAVNFNTDESTYAFFSSAPKLNSIGTGSVQFNEATNKIVKTFTTDNTNVYFAIKVVNINNADLSNTLATMMIEQGTTGSTYEPYGKVWYLNKQIDKIVFKGGEDESWSLQSINSHGIANFQKSIAQYIGTTDNISLVNYFSSQTSTISVETQEGYRLNTAKILYVRIKSNTASTVNDFKAWLSTHNTSVYYVLATPTNTEITDSTLINQLNNLEKAYSYDEQTNISQVNNDLPFIITAEAVLSLQEQIKDLTTKAYVDGLVGDISSVVDAINGEVI